MQILDKKEILKIQDNASEIQDGLFTFVAAGNQVIEMCVYRDDETDLFVIDVYNYKGEEHCAELYNFSHLDPSYVKDGIYENYETVETVAFTEQAEAYACYMQKQIELNHF